MRHEQKNALWREAVGVSRGLAEANLSLYMLPNGAKVACGGRKWEAIAGKQLPVVSC